VKQVDHGGLLQRSWQMGPFPGVGSVKTVWSVAKGNPKALAMLQDSTGKGSREQQATLDHNEHNEHMRPHSLFWWFPDLQQSHRLDAPPQFDPPDHGSLVRIIQMHVKCTKCEMELAKAY